VQELPYKAHYWRKDGGGRMEVAGKREGEVRSYWMT